MVNFSNLERDLTSSRRNARRSESAPLSVLLRLARRLGRFANPAGTADLVGASFLRQEPDLAKEAGLPPRGLSPMTTLTLSVME